ncbi:MAG: hypothetical protein ACRD5L_11015, partial [Bryobacteraceae bacterium]
IEALSKRDDIDPDTFGLWGVNLGAYAALATAEHDPRVRAIALESVYDTPADYLRLQVQRSGLMRIPLIDRMTTAEFNWKNRAEGRPVPLSQGLGKLAGVNKLFLEARDEPDLARVTHKMFLLAPEPKQEAQLDSGNYAGMLDDAKKLYENRLLSFFLLNLPARSNR